MWVYRSTLKIVYIYVRLAYNYWENDKLKFARMQRKYVLRALI
jgi:hypothetical protein